MKNFSFLLITTLLFSGCANQINKEERLEQIYPYSSATYIGYKKDDNSGETGVFGELKFTKSTIILTVDDGYDKTIETCNIRTVTYDDDPNDIKYRTDKGDFIIKVKNDTIKEVTLYTGDFLTIFDRALDKKKIKKPIPSQLDLPSKGWKRIELKEIGSIDLSPSLEIQGGKYKEFNAKARQSMGEYLKINFDQPKLTIQPKGVNEFNQKALKNYIRIMIETIPGEDGDFDKINEEINISKKELTELSQEFKNQILQSFSGTTLKLIEWYPTEIVELNNMSAIRISYKRQLKNQPYVLVEIYRIQNFDRMHSLTISYREKEKSIWKDIISETKKSYRITNIN
jgi:hypothetical protein